jgi:hypothetical protein
VEAGVHCQTRGKGRRRTEERCCTAVDGEDPGRRIHESRRVDGDPTAEEALRVDSPGTEDRRKRCA